MKSLFGSPGKLSGLVLRTFQFVFASASLALMASASGFSSATSFSFLIAAMGLQVLWSFALASIDIYALLFKKDLHNHIFLSLLVVGDWVAAILSLAAACSSGGVNDSNQLPIQSFNRQSIHRLDSRVKSKQSKADLE